MKPICRNIQTGEMYEYLGENKFKNIRTGVEGFVETEKAKNIFVFHVIATQMIFENPIIEELIKTLHLKIDNT